MATESDLKNLKYSGDIRVDSLLMVGTQWNYLLPARNTLYYSFDMTGAVTDAAPSSKGLSAFSAGQQAAAKALLSYASSVTGVNFQLAGSGTTPDIYFANCDIPSPTTTGLCSTQFQYDYQTDGTLTSFSAQAVIFLDNNEFRTQNSQPTAGNDGYETLLHEIGHALGLGHPFGGTYVLPAAQDNTNNTVMSYTDAGQVKSTFQSYDLLALTWLYGKDGLGGNYGFNSKLGPSLNLAVSGTTGTPGNDALVGTGGDDILTGLGGDDAINGWAGVDTAVYQGKMANYVLTQTATGFSIKDTTGVDGTDTLENVERLKFSDKSLALDSSGNGGMAYRIYQAAFNRKPDAAGVGYWMDKLDKGGTLVKVAEGFVGSAEFKSLYGANPSNADLVASFYQNVLHRQGESAGVNYWLGELNSGHQTVANVLAGFSESPENQTQVIGAISLGFEYTPYTL